MSLENSQIAKFFKDQTIFITGGTGLLGKLLIEKLLRTCWDVKRIYMLMRPKHGKTPQKRFEEFFDNSCFKLINNKNFQEKIVLISGDCNQPNLALNKEDFEILKKEVTCVFHVAANVKFDQSLKEASQNVKAAEDVVEIAKQMGNLKVFVYVSTAYSNCIHPHIKEEFYETPLKPDLFLNLVNSIDNRILENLTPTLLDNWPNTYVYAKCITEDLIKNANIGVPIAVVRPSIITNTFEEPAKGWIDNSYGLIGVSFGAVMGVVRSFYVAKKAKLNLVPADHVCNCILAATWKTAVEKCGKPVIYNCVGAPTSCENALGLVNWFYWEFPSDKYLCYKSFKLRDNKFWHDVCVYWHLVIAHFVDCVSSAIGKPTRIAGKYKYLNKILEYTSYFATREWKFDEDNTVSLWEGMSDDDKKIFNFRTKITNWYEYFRSCALGIRLYLLKDPVNTIEKGRRKLRILFVVHYMIVASMYYSVFVLLRILFRF